MAKMINNIGQLVDFKSITDSYRAIRSINDGTNYNGAISPETLRTLATDILDFVPADVTYQDLGITIDNTGGWGNYIETLRKKVEGEYKLTGSESDSHGEISVGGENTSILIHGYEAWSSLSLTAKEQAKMENRNAMSELHEAHTLKYFEKIDEKVWDGLLTSNNGYTRSNATKTWDAQTDVEKLTTIYDGLMKQRVGINRRYWANTVVIDEGMYQDIANLDYSQYKDGTIMKKIMKTFNVKFVASWRVNGYGTGAEKRCIGIYNTDRNSMRNRIPVKLRISPKTKEGWSEKFQGIFRIGGTDIMDLAGGLIIDKL